MKKELKKNKYTSEDKSCTHCGGKISGNGCGDRIIYWCEDCGSNNPASPPNISVEFIEERSPR